MEIPDLIEKHSHINKLTQFNNFALRIPDDKPIISVLVDNESFDIVINDNPIKILINNRTFTKYVFLLNGLKNIYSNGFYFQRPVDGFNQCAIALSFLLTLLSTYNDPIHIFEEDIESIIGNHVIKNDLIKLEYMKNNIKVTDRQYIEKKILFETKIKLNTVYQDIFNKITTYQNEIITFCDNVIKKDKLNNCDIKSLAHILKNNNNSIKTLKIFCEAAYKLSNIKPLVDRKIICPDIFWESIKPQICDIIENTRLFNIHNIGYKSVVSTKVLLEYVKLFQKDTCSDKIAQLIEQSIMLALNREKTIECSNNQDLINITQTNASMFSAIKGIINKSNLMSDENIYTKIIQESINKYSFVQPNTIHQIVKQLVYNRKEINIIDAMIFKTLDQADLYNCGFVAKNKMRQYFDSLPIRTSTINLSYCGKIYNHCWDTTSTKLNELLSKYVRNRVHNDDILSIQMLLLYETIQYIINVLKITHIDTNSNETFPVEYHVKGGFCRDLVLSFLSEAQIEINKNENKKIFKKSIKDIDVAMNIDPEIFTYYFCQIATTKYNISPVKRWNNAEKSDKGKNISVWSVKLIPEHEAIEFVHFRTDTYDPETGGVEAIDSYESIIDDTRRDIPWPSFRLNDFVIVDYFDIIGMLNRGEFVVRTPPIRSELYQMHYNSHNNDQLISVEPINIMNACINFHTHVESAERVLRMFKFISPPFDSCLAYDYDVDTNKFKKIHNGFNIHKSLMGLYQNPQTDKEIETRHMIHQYIKKWLDNNILANVFKSIQSIICYQPDIFFHQFDSIGMIDIIFDNNYCMQSVYKCTKVLKKMFQAFWNSF